MASQMPSYMQDPPLAEAREEDMENFWKHEFLSFALYCPDLERVRGNGVRVTVGVGEKSGDALFKRAGPLLAERLGAECMVFPGHHSGFENWAESFAGRLMSVLGGIEKMKNGMTGELQN